MLRSRALTERQRSRAWRALLAGIVVLLLGASTACSGSGGTAGTGSDVLSIGVPNPPTSLDPQVGSAGGDYSVLYMTYDRLLNSDPKTAAPTPGLATSWSYTDAAKKHLQLVLRKGVKFQDGTPLTADAVAKSLERYKAMGIQSDLDDLQSVSMPSDNVVVLNLSRTNSALPAILSDRAGMILSPTAVTKYGKGFAAHPVGAGPYAFESQVSGSSITLTRFDGYWGGRPKLSKVVWIISTNPTTLENSLRSGQVQIAVRFPAKDAKALAKNKSLVVSAGPSLGYMRIFFNPEKGPLNSANAKGPFKSAEVRQAFNYAINRKQLLEVVNGGIGEIAEGPFPASYPFSDPNAAPPWPYDPAKARQLLKQAGYANGLALTCVSSHGQGYDAATPLLVADLANVGIRLTVKQESLPQQHSESAAGKFPCSFSSWTGKPDPFMTIQQLFHTQGRYNYFHTDFGLDGLINQLQQTHDEKGRVDLVRQIVRDSGTAAPGAPLVRQPSMIAMTRSVGGYVTNIVGKPDLRDVYLKQ